MPPRWRDVVWYSSAILLVAIVHSWTFRSTEPYFNNDETRHVMTGVFFRDSILDVGWTHPKSYATNYYLQYPALGIIVWPPLFYLIEGVAMLAFGTSVLVGKFLILLFLGVACVYAYRLVRLTREPPVAALTAALLGLVPLTHLLSRFVMLEVPTLAWSLVAIFYFERYLKDGKKRDAPIACLAAAAAALTRFDGVFLLPYFLIRLVAMRKLAEVKKPAVWGGIAASLLLTAPYYLFTWSVYGGAIQKQAAEGTSAEFGRFDLARNLNFYPSIIPDQIGVPLCVAAAVGFIGWLLNRQKSMGPAFALFASVYLTFTPLAELERRHALYWAPALCWFAASVIELFHDWRWQAAFAALLIAGPVHHDLHNPTGHVHGYADAARRVLEQPRESNAVFFDGCLSGGFIYQVRVNDPERKITVLRGDKLIYGVLSDPAGGYMDWAKTDDEILAVLHRYDPDWVVIENPQVKFHDLPGPKRLRKCLIDHPERYERVEEFDVQLRTDHELFQGVTLEFYRPQQRNPYREPLREIPMLNLQQPIKN